MDEPSNREAAVHPAEPARAAHSRVAAAWRALLGVTIAGLILVFSQAAGGIAAATLLDLAPTAQDTAALLANGRFLAIASVVSALLTLVLVVVSVLVRRGASLAGALALRPVPPRLVAAWLGVTMLFLLAAVALTAALDHPQSAFVLETYRTADPRWVFWLAIVVLAPVSEEIVFRGLLFTDLAAAGLRPATVVLLTTALFAGLHLGQYAAVDLAVVAGLGLLLGTARARTGSVQPSIAMHVLMNGWALVGAAMTVG